MKRLIIWWPILAVCFLLMVAAGPIGFHTGRRMTDDKPTVFYPVVEDETGATEMRGSFIDAAAWFHDAGGLLAAYAGTGNLLIIDDGTGKTAIGYIGAAGAGETLSAELLEWNQDATYPYDTWTVPANPDIQQAINLASAGDAYDTFLEAGKLYYVAINITTATGAQPTFYNSWTDSYVGTNAVWNHAADGAWTQYGTAIAANLTMRIQVAAASNFSGTFSVKQVTEPNANAVKIYKDKGLTIPGWHEIGVGLNFNAGPNWDFDVYRTRGEATQ